MNIERTKFRRTAEVATLYENMEKLFLSMTLNMEEYGMVESHRGYYDAFQSDYAKLHEVTEILHKFNGNDNDFQEALRDLWRSNEKNVKTFRENYLRQYRALMLKDMSRRAEDEFERLWKRVDGFKTQPAKEENMMDPIMTHNLSWFNA